MDTQIENNKHILENLNKQYNEFKALKDSLESILDTPLSSVPEKQKQIESFYATLDTDLPFQKIIAYHSTVRNTLKKVRSTIFDISEQHLKNNPSIMKTLEKFSIEDIQQLAWPLLKAFYRISWGLNDNRILIGYLYKNKNFIFLKDLYTLDPEGGNITKLDIPFLNLRGILKEVTIKVVDYDNLELDSGQDYIVEEFNIEIGEKRRNSTYLTAAMVVSASKLALLTEENIQKAFLSKKPISNSREKIKDTVLLDDIQKMFDTKIAEFNTIIKEKEARIQELIDQLDNIQIQKTQDIEQLDNDIKNIVDKHRKSLFQQEELDSFNDIISRVSKEDIDYLDDWDNETPIPFIIHNRLVAGCNYQTTQHIIYNMFALLRTNKICIFAGTCGSGKSSFIEKFGEVCGAAVTFIPVKSNWHSPEDMIGYYDSQKGHFIPATDFVKALKFAKAEPDRLHIIVLDEMNLAHVEYYFADILSLSELTDPERRKIKLYSYYNTKENPNYKQDNTTMKTEMLDIPPNVRFIGTINIDETTHYLSPKVLDRVHIVRFDSTTKFSEIGKFKAYKYDKYLSYSKYFEQKDIQIEDTRISNYKKILESINSILHDYKKEFGYRVMAQFNEYMAICDELGMELNEAFENFICQKILPRLTVYNGKEMINKLGESLSKDGEYGSVEYDGDGYIRMDGEEYKKVKSILQEIAEKAEANNNNYYSYWDI